MEGTNRDRKCPYCKGMVIYSGDKGKRLRSGLQMFGSIHTECPHCKKEVVCGYLGRDSYVIVTKEKYQELTKEALAA